MKAITFILSLILIFTLAVGVQARSTTVVVGGPAAAAPAGGPDAWYYSCTGTPASEPSWNAYATTNPNYAACSDITIPAGAGGTATQVSLKRYDTDPTTNYKIAIYVGTTYQTGATCSIASNAAAGWADCTLGTPLSVTAEATYKICSDTDQAGVDSRIMNNVNGAYSAATYSSFPAASYSWTTWTNICPAVRIYVD